MTFGLGQRKGNSTLNRCVHCGFHAGWHFAMDPRCMGKFASPSPQSHEEGVALLVTFDQVVSAHREFLRARQTPVRLICSLLGACMYRTRHQVCWTWNERLETGEHVQRVVASYSSTTAAVRTL